ncbi:MAG: hypothetical protein IPK82_20130 [Polyangiaceae bacterium]|nr:hypothetical protein [Polyangiaceae bacterium]
MTPLSLALAFSGGAALTGLTISALRQAAQLLTGEELLPEGPPPPVPAEWLFYGGARPEVSGWPPKSVLAVFGLKNLPASVVRQVVATSQIVGVPVDTLAAVIAHESGWKPHALYFRDKNDDGTPRKTPFVAAGLCQLTTAAHLEGFDTWEKVKAVASWSVERQLAEVVLPLWYKYRGLSGAHPGHGLMLNFLPDKAGESPETVLGEKGAAGFSGKVYSMNRGFDPTKKGTITIADVYASAARVCRAAKGVRVLASGKLWVPRTRPQNAPAKPTAAPLQLATHTTPAAKAEPPAEPSVDKPAAANQPAPSVTAPGPTSTVSTLAPVTDSNPLPVSTVAAQTALVSSMLEHVKEPATKPAPPLEPSPKPTLLTSVESNVSMSSTPTVKLTDPSRGLLLAAIRSGTEEPVTWVDLPWEGRGVTAGMRLTLKVSAHAVRAPVHVDGMGTLLLRLPVTYREQLEICRLRRWFPLTQSISDAIWFAARRMSPVTLGKWDTPEHQKESSRKMGTVEWSVQFNEKLDSQIPLGGWNRLWAPEGKEWIVHPKIAQRGKSGAVNYGLHGADGAPIQPPGTAHDWEHWDYSQTLRAMQWEGTDPTGAKVSVLDVLRKVGMPKEILAPFSAI